jgi:uracil-DNA glycosylase
LLWAEAKETPVSGAQAGLEAVRAEAAGCTACPLWKNATATVFGEGPSDAPVILVGEQPGDQEDLQGRPFVGPAGRLLDRALAEAGLERERVYVTNAVKHFKFTPRGKRRIHQKPDRGEIEICKGWLLRELDLVRPRVIVAMGATAAQSLLGRNVTIGRERGKFSLYPPASELTVTVHPSYLLRLPDKKAKATEFSRFVGELRAVHDHVAQPLPTSGADGEAQRSLL